jgi:hypothetical protein
LIKNGPKSGPDFGLQVTGLSNPKQTLVQSAANGG